MQPAGSKSHQHRAAVARAQQEGIQGFWGRITGKPTEQQAPSPPSEPAPKQQMANVHVYLNSQADQTPELPPFTTIARGAAYTLRLYDVYPVVEMQYEQRQEGYAALGSYIDGDNADGAGFAYTQPVCMIYGGGASGSKFMQMAIGSRQGAAKDASVSVASLPAPKDPSVRVSIAGGELIAVSQFEGYITPTAAEEARQILLKALKKDGIKLSEEAEAGGFRVGQYGALYQLSGRVNEMYIKVRA